MTHRDPDDRPEVDDASNDGETPPAASNSTPGAWELTVDLDQLRARIEGRQP